MPPKSRVAVVFSRVESLVKGEDGDIVSERGASSNADAVCRTLRDRGCETCLIAVRDDAAGLITQLMRFKPDVVFNLAETVLGDSSLESFVPHLMEFLGIAYTGSDPAAINLCLDKSRTKEVLIARGIPTPAYQVMESTDGGSFGLSFPVIVKPLWEHGSLGINEFSVVHSLPSLLGRVEFILNHYDQPALVETYVGQKEFNISILGNDPPVALPPCEIDYSLMPASMPKIVGFKAKWFPGTSEYEGSLPVCPAPISGQLRDRVERMALAAYTACGLRDYGRVDLRWDMENSPTVIDVNPNPAIAPDTGFILSSKNVGIEYEELLERITRLALLRRDADED